MGRRPPRPDHLLWRGILYRLALSHGRSRVRREALGRLARAGGLHLLERGRRGLSRLTGRTGTIGLLQWLLAVRSGDPRLGLHRLARADAGRDPRLGLPRPVGLLRQRLPVLAGKRLSENRARAGREALLRLAGLADLTRTVRLGGRTRLGVRRDALVPKISLSQSRIAASAATARGGVGRQRRPLLKGRRQRYAGDSEAGGRTRNCPGTDRQRRRPAPLAR